MGDGRARSWLVMLAAVTTSSSLFSFSGRHWRAKKQLETTWAALRGAGNLNDKWVAQVVFERVPFESAKVSLNPFVESGVRGLRSPVPVVRTPDLKSRGVTLRGGACRDNYLVILC